MDIIKSRGLESGCKKEVGALVVAVATTLPNSAAEHRSLLLDRVLDGRIATNDQLAGGVKFLKAVPEGAKPDEAALDKAAGVGIVVSPEGIANAVEAVFGANRDAIVEERYGFNFMKLVQPIKKHSEDMAWADIALIRAQIEEQKVALLGPKTAEDENPKAKPKKAKAPKVQLPNCIACSASNECSGLALPDAKACMHACHLLWLAETARLQYARGVTSKPAVVGIKCITRVQAPAAKKAASEAAPAEEDAWKERDPYAFLPAPEENTGVHTEVKFSDGHVEQYRNTAAQLQAYLKATGGQVRL